jgi:hypothetical protein
MYSIPFIDNNGEPQKFGSEFEQMYQHELRQNMQDPLLPVVDYNTGSKYTLYDPTDGIINQQKLFENNDDPNEDEQTTPAQAAERIRNMQGINRQLTDSEKRYNLYTNDNFDIRFKDELVRESIRGNDNLFSEFSQDHVRAVQQSNTELNREESLYDTPATQQSRALSAISNSGQRGFTNEALSALMEMARQEQRTDAETQSFRDRQMPKATPTTGQRFEEKMKGRPEFRPDTTTTDTTFPRRYNVVMPEVRQRPKSSILYSNIF